MKFLTKSPDKDFIILNLTDPQLANDEIGDDQHPYIRFTDTLTKLIEQTHPDLITITGDLTYGGQFPAYTKLSAFIDSFGIPWAPVFGNHDHETSLESVRMAGDIFCQNKHCLFEHGDESIGVGNYLIGIRENDRLIHTVFMLDSHSYTEWITPEGERDNCYAELPPVHMDWYEQRIDEVKAEGCNYSSIFMHIPLYAYRDAFAAAFKQGLSPKDIPEGDGMQQGCWNEGYEDSFGVWYEGIASCEYDGGQFERILKKDHTKTIVVGHDHINSAVVKYRGVVLAYGVKIGSGCYWNPRLNGGTVAKVASDGSVQLEHVFIEPPKFD